MGTARLSARRHRHTSCVAVATMALVTIQLIEGLERGRVFRDLPTPLTIGREDENGIRLNDERVSRFHAKIQEDGGHLILTDLGSTNGTRVNGHPVQMRVVQYGDQISIGRCLLIVGSREQILMRADELKRGRDSLSGASDQTVAAQEGLAAKEISSDGTDNGSSDHGMPLLERQSELFPDGPPHPPRTLTTLQRAEVSDFVAYCHEQIRIVLKSALETTGDDTDQPNAMSVDWEAWQRLLQTEMALAAYLRKIAEPEV